MTEGLCVDGKKPLVSIVIPTRNESTAIENCLQQFVDLRKEDIEIIVVDGGSTDNTVALSKPFADRVLVSGDCRSAQMNAGADKARGEWLVFLHADTQIFPRFDSFLDHLLVAKNHWGFCRVKLSGRVKIFRMIETAINWRSQLTSVATGDQMIFVRKAIFEQLHGFPEIPLMEDVAISKKLRPLSAALVWPHPVITSSRKWEKNGIFNTIFLMWRLRFAYFCGVSPHKLVNEYYG
jgi:rSAM/selenodomain-associated transferase 2